VNLEKILLKKSEGLGPDVTFNALRGWYGGADYPERTTLDWVIVGGESGPGARPMHPDWAQSLRDQCVTAKVPFFFKQWGEWAPFSTLPSNSKSNGHVWDNGSTFTSVARVGKKAAGAQIDGREWRQFPEVRG
jgi:protein gp37